MKIRKQLKRFKKAFETPKERRERKAREFKLSVMRTTFSALGFIIAFFALLLQVVVALKVYRII